MKHSEAASILAKISAFDRRTVGEADIEAWREALDGMITLADAMTAVRDHFRESDDWLMPKHIIDRSRKLRSARIAAAGVPDYPPNLTQAQERAWLIAFHRALDYHDGNVVIAQGSADRQANITRIESVPVDPERAMRLIAEFAQRNPKAIEHEPGTVGASHAEWKRQNALSESAAAS